MKKPAPPAAPEPPAAVPAPSSRLRFASEFHSRAPSLSERLVTRCWLLEIFTAGRVGIDVERRGWRLLSRGEGMLYSPGTIYSERLRREDGSTRYSSLYVQFDDPSGALQQRLGSARYAAVRDVDGAGQNLLERVLTNFDAGPVAALWAWGSFYELIALLLSADTRGGGGEWIIGRREFMAPELVTEVHRYLRQHLDRRVRLAELAREVGLSESGVSHAYRRLTGRTPMATLRSLRIDAAKVKLVRGNLKLEAIARETGFADAFHLSRTFKQVVGCSPREYLRSAREQLAADERP